MATAGTQLPGPGVGPIAWVLRTSGEKASESFGWLGRAVKFMTVPKGSTTQKVAATGPTLIATAVYNTSALWMPTLMVQSMGKVLAYATITAVGCPAAPATLIIGVTGGTYIAFTSIGNAITWAKARGEKSIEVILEQLKTDHYEWQEQVQKRSGALEELEHNLAELQSQMELQSSAASYHESEVAKLKTALQDLEKEKLSFTDATEDAERAANTQAIATAIQALASHQEICLNFDRERARLEAEKVELNEHIAEAEQTFAEAKEMLSDTERRLQEAMDAVAQEEKLQDKEKATTPDGDVGNIDDFFIIEIAVDNDDE